MDHALRGEAVAERDLRVPGRAAAERAALAQQLRAGCTVDRAVDAATPEQGVVGRVDDRVDLEPRDVGFDGEQTARHGAFSAARGLRGDAVPDAVRLAA